MFGFHLQEKTQMETMVSKAKQKGTAAETAVVNYVKQPTDAYPDGAFPYAERRTLHGINDKGDINLGGVPVVLEVKNHKAFDLAGWIRELEDEVRNAGADLGAVVAKKRGTTDAGEWYAILPFKDLVYLLKEAGY